MKLLYVEWVDSCMVVGGVWKKGDDVRESEPALVKSVGFVVAQDKQRIVLAAHVAVDGSDSFGGDMCIPRSAVKRVRRLKL